MSVPNWLQSKLGSGYTNDALWRALRAEAEADKATTQAVFWRTRAIELGAGEDEWQKHMAEAAKGMRDANFDRRTGTLLSDDVQPRSDQRD